MSQSNSTTNTKDLLTTSNLEFFKKLLSDKIFLKTVLQEILNTATVSTKNDRQEQYNNNFIFSAFIPSVNDIDFLESVKSSTQISNTNKGCKDVVCIDTQIYSNTDKNNVSNTQTSKFGILKLSEYKLNPKLKSLRNNTFFGTPMMSNEILHCKKHNINNTKIHKCKITTNQNKKTTKNLQHMFTVLNVH